MNAMDHSESRPASRRPALLATILVLVAMVLLNAAAFSRRKRLAGLRVPAGELPVAATLAASLGPQWVVAYGRDKLGLTQGGALQVERTLADGASLLSAGPEQGPQGRRESDAPSPGAGQASKPGHSAPE